MRPKAALLRLSRAVLVEIIQTRLAERHDPGMPGQCDQFVGGNSVFFIGMMRMGADRAIDDWKPLGDFKQSAKPSHPRRDGDDTSNACSRSPCHDAIEVVGKIRKIQVAMA